MNNLVFRAGTVIAASAVAMSVVWGVFVPYGYPWPSVAWAILAGGVVAGMARMSMRPDPSMNDVLNGVEGEPVPVARPLPSTRAAS